MTKKHFKAIAEVFKKNMPKVDTTYQEQVKCYHKAIADLGSYFKEVNPLFNCAKFSNAIYTE